MEALFDIFIQLAIWTVYILLGCAVLSIAIQVILVFLGILRMGTPPWHAWLHRRD